MLAVFRKVARDHVVLRVFGDAGWHGKDYLGFDALLLPLSEDGASVNMVMCAFTFDARRQLLRRLATLH